MPTYHGRSGKRGPIYWVQWPHQFQTSLPTLLWSPPREVGVSRRHHAESKIRLPPNLFSFPYTGMVSSLSHIQPVRYGAGFFQNLFNIFANLDASAALFITINIKRFPKTTTVFNHSNRKQFAVISTNGVTNLTIIEDLDRDNSFVDVKVSLIFRVRVIFRFANTFQYNLFSVSLYLLNRHNRDLALVLKKLQQRIKKTRRLQIGINKVMFPISIINFVGN